MTKKEDPQMPPHEVNNGIWLVLNNVHEFVEDAHQSLNQKRTTHVAGFLELAIQELGKAELLRREYEKILKQNMEDAKAGKIIRLKCVKVEGFTDHNKKHSLGITLLPEDATRIELTKLSGKGYEKEDVTIDEGLRLLDFYVDYENGWKFPRLGMGFRRPEPPKSELMKLTKLADAIEKAADEFPKSYQNAPL